MNQPATNQENVNDIQEYVNDIIKVEYLDDMFAGYILNKEENDEFKHERYRKKFHELIKKCNNDQLDKFVIDFINAISDVNGQKQKLLFSILESSVQQNVLSTMIVCQSLLNADKLQFTNEQFWCASFNLIMKIIDKADYKEIRDLLKIMLDLIPNIPSSFNIALLPQLNAIYQIFEHVFNRNLALFPAYLVFDEIRKKTHLNKIGTHWKFSRLISSFVESFKPVANMCSLTGRTKLYPVIYNRSNSEKKVWQLDGQCKFAFKGLLPFDEELLKPQHHFLRYAIMQPYSKEFIQSFLQIKSRSFMIEDVLNEIIISLMERTETTELSQLINQWQVFTNNIRDYSPYVFYHEMIKRLIPILVKKNLKKGRDQLMWLILQLLPLAFTKVSFNYFIPLIKLIDVLYCEKEPLPLPNLNSPLCVQNFAASSIWIIAMMKADAEKLKLTRTSPIVLKNQIEFIKQNALNISQHNLDLDFKLSIIGNAYFGNFTNTPNEPLNKILNNLIDYISGKNQQQQLGQSTLGKPLPVAFLDSLSVEMRLVLAQHLNNLIKHVMNNKESTQPISPVILESFFRLAVYSEIENPYLKSYINFLIPSKSNHLSVNVHNLLEAWIYRTNHTKLNFRMQLINLLNNPTYISNFQHQLKLCIENILLKLVLKLSASDIIIVLTQIQTFDNLISKDSEEFNKILILVIARAIHITHYSETLSSEWCKDILSNITKNTPFAWSLSTIKCFPKHMNEFYLKQQQNQNNQNNRRQMINSVDEEYRKFVSMNNENEIIQYFSQTSKLFICVIWKSLLENNHLNPIAFKILDNLTSKQYTANIRSFCDYLLFELAKSPGQQLIKYIDNLNDLIWKYHVFSLDKLFLCLALRPFEEEIEFNVCLLIIQHILLKKNEFRNRMNEFVKDFTPDYWLNDNLQEKQTAFLSKNPEKFFFELIADQPNKPPETVKPPIHSYYFSNVCLRFLPVLDLIIHRYLEQDIQAETNIINNTNTIMETIIDLMSPLYKFHDQPITFLYNTLHYYEPKLRNKPLIKKKLVSAVLNPFREIRSKDWALSEDYLNYISSNTDWNPSLEYYVKLVGRLVDTIKGKQVYPNFDWKFYEFTNAGCHALHIICVELMALPKMGNVVANNLIDIIMIGHKTIPRSDIMNWINAIGLILTALPQDYKSVLNNRLIQMLQSPILAEPDKNVDIFRIVDFTASHNSFTELQITYLIALAHSFYQHSYIGQVSLFPEFLSERVKPIIKTEEQFIFICHIVAPFLDRLVVERTRIACDLNILLYQLLEIVDKNVNDFHYMEPICDLLYYIKYSFTGDAVKDDIGPYILKLREPLKMRLRFVVHLQVPASIQNNQMILTKQEQINSSNQLSLKHSLDTSFDTSIKRLKT